QATSVYGIALGMAIPVLFIPSSLIGSIAVVIAPELSENFYKNKTEKLKNDVEKTVKAGFFIAVVLIPFLFVLGKDIGIFIYSNEFSGEIIQKCSFILLPMCVSMITTTILNSMNCEIKTLLYFFIGAAAELISILTLTSFIGIWSYMIGTSLNFIITALLNLFLLKKKCSGIKLFNYFLKCVLACLACCLFGALLRNLFSSINVLLTIILCGIGVGVFSIILFYVLGIFNFKPIKKLIAKN
ncbi:MAG: polysaccharide biosynthesis C-terminal domain-containing protein, partial [Clostridia bacterium]|nr:polysaccharide biosynthesis C-terminal domain-containing protein [Clostridia bacterium]